jgi:hypothetical protein
MSGNRSGDHFGARRLFDRSGLPNRRKANRRQRPASVECRGHRFVEANGGLGVLELIALVNRPFRCKVNNEQQSGCGQVFQWLTYEQRGDHVRQDNGIDILIGCGEL